MTVWKGSRFSTAKAYLKPALAKKNVQLITKVLVDKIIFQEDKAKGVEVFHRGQKKPLVQILVLFYQLALSIVQQFFKDRVLERVMI